MSIFSRAVNFVFGEQIAQAVSARVNLAVQALDDVRDRQWGTSATVKDRQSWNRADVLKDVFDAWRENPLARRIVGLTSQYVVGGGLGIASEDDETNAFLQEWWAHRLNRMVIRAYEWCDELTRAGELFIVLSTDAGGMSYVRAVPASEIEEIETAPNDIEQELFFKQKPSGDQTDGTRWTGYDELHYQIEGGEADGSFKTVMLHYAINRPVGAKFGESDLAPLLKWIVRYGAWLEDRVRLNRFRQAFMWIVKKAFRDEGERLARQAELNANPPNPGSILVVNDDETWSVEHPKLDSFEAGSDGMAIKKMISSGAGVPLHFLAEPESSTRTTAEAAGGPTFRHYEQRQIFFLWMLEDICKIVVRRAALAKRGKVKADAKVKARGTDIFARDNAGLAAAATAIIDSFVVLRDRQLIDDAELVRLAYKFAGEIVDIPALLARGAKAPKVEHPALPKKGTGSVAPTAEAIAKKELENS